MNCEADINTLCLLNSYCISCTYSATIWIMVQDHVQPCQQLQEAAGNFKAQIQCLS